MHNHKNTLLSSVSHRAIHVATRRMTIILPNPESLHVGYSINRVAAFGCDYVMSGPPVIKDGDHYRFARTRTALRSVPFEKGDSIQFVVVLDKVSNRKTWTLGTDVEEAVA